MRRHKVVIQAVLTVGAMKNTGENDCLMKSVRGSPALHTKLDNRGGNRNLPSFKDAESILKAKKV